MTMEIGEMLKEKRDEILAIAKQHGGRKVRIFGSIARGQGKEDSDIDLLVELEPGRSLLDIIAIKQDLEDLLWGGVAHDLVGEIDHLLQGVQGGSALGLARLRGHALVQGQLKPPHQQAIPVGDVGGADAAAVEVQLTASAEHRDRVVFPFTHHVQVGGGQGGVLQYDIVAAGSPDGDDGLAEGGVAGGAADRVRDSKVGQGRLSGSRPIYLFLGGSSASGALAVPHPFKAGARVVDSEDPSAFGGVAGQHRQPEAQIPVLGGGGEGAHVLWGEDLQRQGRAGVTPVVGALGDVEQPQPVEATAHQELPVSLPGERVEFVLALGGRGGVQFQPHLDAQHAREGLPQGEQRALDRLLMGELVYAQG